MEAAMRKLIAATALAVAVVAVTTLPALAGEDPAGWAGAGHGNGTITVRVGDQVKRPGGHPRGDGGGSASGGGSSSAATVTCNSAGCSTTAVGGVQGPANPAPPIDPVVVARQAMATKALLKPAIGMSPRPDADQLVNPQHTTTGGSWLWIDPAGWHAVTASRTLGAELVSVTATPDSVTWRLTDSPEDGQVVCNGPGKPYNASLPPEAQATDCRYDYRHATADGTVTATVNWQVNWFATGPIEAAGSWQQATSASTSVRVVGAESVNSG